MANSMTGFGRGEAQGLGYQFSIEMKSVNHRFLEIMVRIPRNFNILEERLRKIIQERVQRGRIDVFVNIKETEEKKRMVKVDKDLALSYDKTLKELALALQTKYETDIYRLAGLPEVLTVEEPEMEPDVLWEIFQTALLEALEGFSKMRVIEGQKLTEDLLGRLHIIAGEMQKITERSDSVVLDYQTRLKERIQVLLGDPALLDESRLANEVAIFSDRSSIAEEIVRFDSHLNQCRNTLQGKEPVGRKLDFLVQEMNREINTIGSKANDLVITQTVVSVKSELEKIREQIQNLE